MIFYDDDGGDHSTLYNEDPFIRGEFWKFDFVPRDGGWDNINIGIIHGQSITDLTHWYSKKLNGMVIETLAEEDFRALNAALSFREANLPYNLLFNNCAHACRFVLNATELDLGNPYFDTPTKLFKDLWNADEKRKAGDK